jgi:hypothetical protein
MEARALIEGASFGPETVKAICEAFDQTWARLAPIFSDVPGEIETARIRLAEAILSVTTEGSTDVVALKTNALYAMARSLSRRFMTSRRRLSLLLSRIGDVCRDG